MAFALRGPWAAEWLWEGLQCRPCHLHTWGGAIYTCQCCLHVLGTLFHTGFWGSARTPSHFLGLGSPSAVGLGGVPALPPVAWTTWLRPPVPSPCPSVLGTTPQRMMVEAMALGGHAAGGRRGRRRGGAEGPRVVGWARGVRQGAWGPFGRTEGGSPEERWAGWPGGATGHRAGLPGTRWGWCGVC